MYKIFPDRSLFQEKDEFPRAGTVLHTRERGVGGEGGVLYHSQ